MKDWRERDRGEITKCEGLTVLQKLVYGPTDEERVHSPASHVAGPTTGAEIQTDETEGQGLPALLSRLCCPAQVPKTAHQHYETTGPLPNDHGQEKSKPFCGPLSLQTGSLM